MAEKSGHLPVFSTLRQINMPRNAARLAVPLWRRADLLCRAPGDDQMSIKGPLPYWAILVILGVVGIALVFAPAFFEWQWDHGVVSAIGTALLVSAFLGATIDRWMKTELSKDAINAAFNFVVPPEYISEIRRILSYHFLCVQHEMHYKIMKLDDNSVRVETSMERRIKNIGHAPEIFTPILHLDDWHYQERTAIKRFEIRDGDRVIKIDKEQDEGYRVKREGDPLTVRPGQIITTISVFTETKHINDHVTQVFLTPTVNPRIVVDEIDESLSYDIDFGVINASIDEAAISTARVLQGTYFAPGHMRLRWWPKEHERAG